MEITEVRVKLMNRPNDKLRAFCSITFNSCFVVRDLKIIEGEKGIFVAMPSRKITDHCNKCRAKNSIIGKFCSECGCKLEHANSGTLQRVRVYADIAHPITAKMRDIINDAVLGGYQREIEHSKQPGYKPVNLEEPTNFSEIQE